MQPTIFKIRLYGDLCLRKKSVPVEVVGPSERLFIQSMIETMHQNKGIGLAANQVGVNQRIFVVDIGQGPMAFVDPQIVKKFGAVEMDEGCLSLPGITVNVKRAQKVLVRYKDEYNQLQEKVFEDLLGRVILHETDHLNGKLIIDYAGLRQRRKLIQRLKETQKTKNVIV